jgi:hypothetical protein
MNITVIQTLWRCIKRPSQKTLAKLPFVKPDPQWDYKPARKQRHGLSMTLILLVAASTAFGMIGETPQQMESSRPTVVEKTQDGDVLGWTVYYPSLGRRPLIHEGIFAYGVAVAEQYFWPDHRPMSWQEIEVFLRPYRAFKRSPVEIMNNGMAHTFGLLFNNGNPFAIVLYDKSDHSLSIWQSSLFANDQPPPVKQAQVAPTPVYQPEPTAVSVATPTPAPTRKDCMVVATELLHRVKDGSCWSNILTFHLLVDGQRLPAGHAMVLWKVTPEGRVYAADADGTVELNTSSTELVDVLNDLSKYHSAKYSKQIWLDGNYVVGSLTLNSKTELQPPLPESK